MMTVICLATMHVSDTHTWNFNTHQLVDDNISINSPSSSYISYLTASRIDPFHVQYDLEAKI
jgi:hypothetical protein